MRWASFVAALLFLGQPWSAPARGADASPPTAAKAQAGLAVWDTGRPSATPLAPSALAGKNDWTALPAGRLAASFQGDAVLTNGRVTAVLRKQEGTVEVHGAGTADAAPRLRLRLLTGAGQPAARLERVALVENTRGAACLEAAYQTEQGAEVAAKVRLKRGEVSLQVEPGVGAGRLRVECPGRFVVLPDFFADDIVIDARKIPLAGVEVPSENFLLHLTGKGDGMAMCVFENRQQDVKVALAGDGPDRKATSSEIAFEGKKVWVGLLEAPGLWHTADLDSASVAAQSLGWTMPFPAQWRVDFARGVDLTDSWEMLLPDPKSDGFRKPSWLGAGEERLPATRRRWNTVLGTYAYPCWADRSGEGHVQPLKHKALRLEGPVVVYPINRVQETPLDAYTVVDVMRNTLGVGPCEHILDLEGQRSEYKGRATCNVRDRLGEIYGARQQKQKRADVEKILDEGLTFVKHIRGRIERYVAFGQKMRAYLDEQRKAHPELADFISEMEALTREIDTRVAARADKIQTPAHVARMNAEFRKTVLDDDGPDALAHCKQYTAALVTIGDNQDELSGECRWVVKALRQRAGIRMALDPRVAPVAAEIRARTQEALRNPASHEGAHH